LLTVTNWLACSPAPVVAVRMALTVCVPLLDERDERVRQEYVHVADRQVRTKALSTYTFSERRLVADVCAVTLTMPEAGFGAVMVVVAWDVATKAKTKNRARRTDERLIFMSRRQCTRRATANVWNSQQNRCGIILDCPDYAAFI
jgi:hypothetical protein